MLRAVVRDKASLQGIAHQLAARGHVVVQVPQPLVREVELEGDVNRLICGPLQLQPLHKDVVLPDCFCFPLNPPVIPPVGIERGRQEGHGDDDVRISHLSSLRSDSPPGGSPVSLSSACNPSP